MISCSIVVFGNSLGGVVMMNIVPFPKYLEDQLPLDRDYSVFFINMYYANISSFFDKNGDKKSIVYSEFDDSGYLERYSFDWFFFELGAAKSLKKNIDLQIVCPMVIQKRKVDIVTNGDVMEQSDSKYSFGDLDIKSKWEVFSEQSDRLG